MGSREEILADFQACTGIDDVEIAICHLEAANWILHEAVSKAMSDSLTSGSTSVPPVLNADPTPPPRSTVTSSTPPPVSPPLVDMTSRIAQSLRAGPAGVSMAEDFFGLPSTSMPRTRMLEFNIQFKDRMIHLKVPDNEELRTLKTLIQNESGIPPCSQELQGFNRGNMPFPFTDRLKLSEMNLPKENFLYLVSDQTDDQNGVDASMPSEEDAADFQLTIKSEERDEPYVLNYPPIRSVLNVKMDVSDLTGIPVSKQSWRGWPENISDELSLAQIGIPRQHDLFVRPISDASPARSMPVLVTSDDHVMTNQDSDDDFEEIHAESHLDDDYDDIFMSTSRSTRAANGRLQTLIPDDFGDETMAAIRFGEEFQSRYGQPHPDFFPASLDEAIKESCLQPAKNRKMLAVYLHHDSSVLTNVFCTQALCADTVCHFLNENFISFGWDLTHKSNKDRAVDMITRHFGSVAAMSIKNMDVEKFPILALVYRLRGTTEIFEMIHGNVTLDELMSRLLSAFETYQSQLVVEIREEEERLARDAVKREQDLAFEMSLVADREKEAQRKREEEERIKQEQQLEQERLEAEQKRREEEAAMERKRVEIKRRLPAEPKPSDSAKISTIRFRLPATESPENLGARQVVRRFLATDKLNLVFDFLTAEGYPPENFKVISSFPRRDLTQLDASKNLEELKLFPQETLTLEEK